MRRKDREVTDSEKIFAILEKCHCCRIGFNDNGRVYIVPLNFGYVREEDRCVFYFHSAKEGRKIDLIGQSPEVRFELDTDYQLHEAATACNFSARFQSIIGSGTVQMVEDPEEKRVGLLAVMRHTAGSDEWGFSEKMLQAVAVFKLTVTEWSCKVHE